MILQYLKSSAKTYFLQIIKHRQTFFFFFFAVDLNINALDYESNKDIQHFLSSMFQYNMIPTRNKPTRGTRNTAEAKTRIITNTVTSVEYTRLEQ